MIKNKISNKGISLISLVIAVLILIVITSILVYNVNTSLYTKRLTSMYSDIALLKDKINIYYAKYKTLPVINEKYTNTAKLNGILENEGDTYYVIDIEALDNVILSYGKEYEYYKNTRNDSIEDLYIINEKTLHIYYVKGIEFDKQMYYTNLEEYSVSEQNSNIETPQWSDPFTETGKYTDKDGMVAYIPKGFSVSLKEGENSIKNGLVVKDKKENEFVWVPVSGMDYTYDRYVFSNSNWKYSQQLREFDLETKSYKIGRVGEETAHIYVEAIPEDEKLSVDYYGGYYIGRYETGVESTTQRTNTSSQTVTPVIKKDKVVYNYIIYTNALARAKGLYSKTKDGVISKLCSSYAWDTALKFIESNKENEGWATNSVGGNYATKDGGTGKIHNTGYFSKNNIYDMGGNCWEIVTETCWSNKNHVNRGGYWGSGTTEGYTIGSSAAIRNSTTSSSPVASDSFRITMYIAVPE